MQNFSTKSTVHFNQSEYQIRTSNNGQLNKIVSSIFRDGGFVQSKEIIYDGKNENEVLAQLKKFHNKSRNGLESLFDLSKKLEADGNVELLNMLGLIFQKEYLYTEAIDQFLVAIRLDANQPLTYGNLGKVLLLVNKYDHAIKAFEKAIRQCPDYPDLYNNLGMVYLEIDSCRNAMNQFDMAIRLNPYYAEAYLNRGLAFLLNQIKRADYELTINYVYEVKASLENTVQLNPSYQNSNYLKAMEYIEANKPEEALEELKLAKKNGAHSSSLDDKYTYYLKLIYGHKENQYDVIWSYIKLLQNHLKKYPGHADIYNDLGLAYCLLRNIINEKAIKSFEHALKINPNFKKAQRNLKLSNFEKKGSEIFLKALTQNGRYKYKGEKSADQEDTTSNPKMIE